MPIKLLQPAMKWEVMYITPHVLAASVLMCGSAQTHFSLSHCPWLITALISWESFVFQLTEKSPPKKMKIKICLPAAKDFW